MYIANMQEVIGDFRDYDKDTQARLARTLKRYAMKVQDRASTTLTRRIIHKAKSSGNLAGGITPERKSRLTWWIAPLDRWVYGEYVETGKTKKGKYRGNFRGHWYMRDTVNKLKEPFAADLKKDIRVHEE